MAGQLEELQQAVNTLKTTLSKPRIIAPRADARFLFELSSGVYPTRLNQKELDDLLKGSSGRSQGTSLKRGSATIDWNRISGDSPLDEQPVALMSGVLSSLGIEKNKVSVPGSAEKISLEQAPLTIRIEQAFQALGYEDWRQERIRFSALVSYLQAPTHEGETSLACVSAVFRGYFTPHRYIPGAGSGWNYVRRLSAYLGVGSPMGSTEKSRLNSSAIFSAGLGYDINHEFTVMVGLGSASWITGTSSTRRNTLQVGIAINSEFLKPLLGFAK